jgi:hypothetical protein
MKAYGKMEVQLAPVLILTVDEGEWRAPHSCGLQSRRREKSLTFSAN